MARSIKENVHHVLDGYFGESLENSENEEVLRQHLYDPMTEVAQNAYHEGLKRGDARLKRQMEHQRNRAAAANKNAARLFKDACEARERARVAEARVEAIPPHIRAMFKI